MIWVLLYIVWVAAHYIAVRQLVRSSHGEWTVIDRTFALGICAVPVIGSVLLICVLCSYLETEINWSKPAKW